MLLLLMGLLTSFEEHRFHKPALRRSLQHRSFHSLQAFIQLSRPLEVQNPSLKSLSSLLMVPSPEESIVWKSFFTFLPNEPHSASAPNCYLTWLSATCEILKSRTEFQALRPTKVLKSRGFNFERSCGSEGRKTLS